jgi:hypothetical protein
MTSTAAWKSPVQLVENESIFPGSAMLSVPRAEGPAAHTPGAQAQPVRAAHWGPAQGMSS